MELTWVCKNSDCGLSYFNISGLASWLETTREKAVNCPACQEPLAFMDRGDHALGDTRPPAVKLHAQPYEPNPRCFLNFLQVREHPDSKRAREKREGKHRQRRFAKWG